MVSLLKLAEITEQGVKFESPHDGSEMMLTPEKSIQIQNSIGIRLINYLFLPHTCPFCSQIWFLSRKISTVLDFNENPLSIKFIYGNFVEQSIFYHSLV